MADLLKLNRLQMSSGGEISLVLPEKTVGMLLGDADSGSDRLLRMVAGLYPFEEGEIFLRGDLIAREGKQPPPWEREIAFVPAQASFYPHLNVLENLKVAVKPHTSRNRRRYCLRMLAEMGLEEYANLYPSELTAEELRYLLVARAMLTRPALLLLEEPLAPLESDAQIDFIRHLPLMLEPFNCGVLISTALQGEVRFAADWAGVMEHELLLQWDRPIDLYRTPKKRGVAHYMGEGVLIKGVVHDELRLDTELGMVEHPTGFGLPTGSRIELLIRPEDIVFDERSRRRARIVQRSAQGGKTVYQLQLTPEIEMERAFSSHLDERISGELRYRLEIRFMVLFKRRAVE